MKNRLLRNPNLFKEFAQGRQVCSNPILVFTGGNGSNDLGRVSDLIERFVLDILSISIDTSSNCRGLT
jgi:hypothetical protein